MQIRVGFEMAYQCPSPTPMIVALSIHHSRASDLVRPDYLVTQPAVPVSAYRDLFGNWCGRLVAPPEVAQPPVHGHRRIEGVEVHQVTEGEHPRPTGALAEAVLIVDRPEVVFPRRLRTVYVRQELTQVVEHDRPRAVSCSALETEAEAVKTAVLCLIHAVGPYRPIMAQKPAALNDLSWDWRF